MAQVTISVTKRTAFRDSTQEFSNVYTYGAVGPNPTAADAEDLLDELVAFEKSIHSTAVTFVHGRVWSSGGTQAQNVLIFQKALSGAGSALLSGTPIDKERAFLIQWRAGVDSRGRPVSLKKWFHTCGLFGTVNAVNTAIAENTAGFTQAQRDQIAGLADGCTRLGTLEEWGLIADSGRQRDGGPPTAHKYLEHHQLGDQWRG